MTEARNVPITLEPLAAAHRDGAAALWGDPAVIRFTNVERPLNREEAAERLELLLAGTAAENAASVRILEGLGFARTAVHPGALERDGVRRDVWDYMLRLGGREEECL